MVVCANLHGSRVFCLGTRVGWRPWRALPSLLLAMALLEARRLEGLDIKLVPQATGTGLCKPVSYGKDGHLRRSGH